MDISSLRDRSTKVLTVGELNSYVKNLLEGNRLLSSVTVKGEISNFIHHRNGHFYFSLKDDSGQIKSVMFRSNVLSLRFMPENGMRVVAHGSVSVYVRDGAYQLYVNSLEPDGIGALYVAYEQLKARLSDEGLFDEERKRAIPTVPSAIGVITSPTGAAVRDIINVLGRRYPLAKVYIYPSLVQGDGAEEQLIKGIDYFERSRLVDTVIIGRGGGSIEDLWAFNGERLARRISAATVPIISAVGHETDFTICDFVSDLRAPTPSAAAELAVPDVSQILQYLDSISDKAVRSLELITEKMRARLSRLLVREALSHPQNLYQDKKNELSNITAKLAMLWENGFTARNSELALICGKLVSLNPLSVLSRGYSVVQKPGADGVVSSVRQLSCSDVISITLSDGKALATVNSVGKNSEELK